MVEPDYQRDGVTLYLGDCLDVLPTLAAGSVGAVVTDPPYPNNAGHFDAEVGAARLACEMFPGVADTVAVFWTEMERPPVPLPLVAVHIWHRSNVNGRPYEPVYHFHPDGRKRRSCLKAHAVPFGGVGPGCREYAGHPTQKPIAWMAWLLDRLKADAPCDPFMGSGTTGVACVQTDRRFVGIEKEPKYFEIAVKRIEAAIAQRAEQLPFTEAS